MNNFREIFILETLFSIRCKNKFICKLGKILQGVIFDLEI